MPPQPGGTSDGRAVLRRGVDEAAAHVVRMCWRLVVRVHRARPGSKLDPQIAREWKSHVASAAALPSRSEYNVSHRELALWRAEGRLEGVRKFTEPFSLERQQWTAQAHGKEGRCCCGAPCARGVPSGGGGGRGSRNNSKVSWSRASASSPHRERAIERPSPLRPCPLSRSPRDAACPLLAP